MPTLSELRQQHIERFGEYCQWPGCTFPISYVNPLQLAHLKARGMGGSHFRDTIENTVLLCREHHMIQEGESVTHRKFHVTELLRAYLMLVRGGVR